MKIKNFDDITFEKEQLDFMADDMLRKKGWKQTCDVPGSLWLWERKLSDGRVALVNKVSAIAMQGWFDNYGDGLRNSKDVK